MQRRNLLATGVVIASGTIGGCLGGDGGPIGGDGEQTDETATSDSNGGTPSSPDEPDAGEVSFSVEPSTDEIDWGEEYSVTVSARAGEEPPEVATSIFYQAAGDADWSGSFGSAEKRWRLDAEESKTETFEITPPDVGEFTLGLMDLSEDTVVEEWELVVAPPVQAFGEAVSYYDGLDVTLDVELHEWLELELKWDHDPIETGTYSVRPRDGQWVKVWVTAENTNTNEKVQLPEDKDFSGLVGRSQMNQFRGYNVDVGAGTDYEIDGTPPEPDKGGGHYVEMDGENMTQEGYWSPPDELISGALEEGWVLFDTDGDVSAEDIQIRLGRNDVRATWE